ncbi:Protein of unknown function [Parasphingorhabdus marina DSM 22363]|uniref:DUF3572 domain-containing protein n=1 Tax=Parasphingorhabdus marina DSM 22363 TaxID=1123272 RepID=A0A1N6CNG7_9SPHN|nr:DUF3572 domain-containing protein [Parasphingorhabdus marina]SIN60047.1 Protein of unknown function [Parasphingorhabdus marina DSM 22363]
METNHNMEEQTELLALQALSWVLEDEDRASRLLALTGLDPRQLRSGLEDPALLSSLLGFLANHEPDLLACAEAIDVPPEQLAAAAGYLNRTGDFS